MSTITSTYTAPTAHTQYVPPMPRAQTPPLSTWSQLINILDAEEGPYTVWTDFLSESIRDWGAEALRDSEAEFLESLEDSKEQLREIFQDPILFIAMSRPVVVTQDSSLIDENGSPYLINEETYTIPKEASYQEDTLQFYQKYIDYKSQKASKISYVPHDLARAVIELLQLFPNDPQYKPLDEIVDPTSPRANETLVLAELSSLNQAFIGHGMELQSQKMTKEDLLAEATGNAVSEEVRRQYETEFRVHEQKIRDSYETFNNFLGDTKTKHDERIEEATNRLDANRLVTQVAQGKIQETKARILTEQARLDAIRSRVSSTIQRCQREVTEYGQATYDAVRKANHSDVGYGNPRRFS